MKNMKSSGIRILLTATLVFAAIPSVADRLPAGFEDHGPAAPTGQETFGGSAFATVDAEGSRLVFMKLWAGGQGYYLFIDAETGETEQIHPGINGGGGWPPLLTDENKVYDTMGAWLMEIDVPAREVRRVGRLPSGRSLGLGNTVDENGIVYAGIFPSGNLVSYDPATEDFTDHGRLVEEDWNQYLRPMVTDGEGWVYMGIGQKLAQVLGYHPASGETRAYVPEDERESGAGEVRLGADGHVYGNAPGWSWHRLSGGEATPVDEPAAASSSRERYTRPRTAEGNRFPDGSRLTGIDLVRRTITILDTDAEEPREIRFDYDSPGVPVYSMVAGPDGNIYGATGNPCHLWRLQPDTGEMDDWRVGGGHLNQLVLQNGKIYGGKYSQGSIYEFDPSNLFRDEEKTRIRWRSVQEGSYGFRGDPDMVGRPYAMLAHPDGRHVVMGGNPARVEIGGGLLIVDIEDEKTTALLPEDLIPDQGVMALAALPGGDLIVGSTTAAATAGTSGASEALIYRLDWDTRKVVGTWKPDPAPGSIRDLIVAGDGLVFGLATGNRFFVFDPASGEFVHDEEVTEYGGLTGGQAPRSMALGPGGNLYVLFRDAIARIDPETFEHREVARPGTPINSGIVIQDDRLYFIGGGRLRLYSYELNQQSGPD